MRYVLTIFLTVILCFSCNHRLDTEEATRSLKVLDSNVLHLMNEVGDRPEFEAFFKLNKEDQLPFDFYLGLLSDRNSKTFDIEQFAGTYTWDTATNDYHYSSNPQPVIKVIFPLNDETGNTARLVVEEYVDRKVDALRSYPITIREKIYVDNVLKLQLNYESAIKDKMPLDSKLSLDGNDIKFDIDMQRTRDDDEGIMNMDIRLAYMNKELSRTQLWCDLGYGKTGYYFRRVNFRSRLFEHVVKGQINYQRIDPTAEYYCASFNENADIKLYEKGREVCDILVAQEEGEEEIELHAKFIHGQVFGLHEYLLFIDELYHYKL